MSTAPVPSTDELKRRRAIELLDSHPTMAVREIAREVGMPESTLRKVKADHEVTRLQLLTLPVEKIRTDGGTQVRAAERPDVIADYAERLDAILRSHPLVVYFDGTDYWLSDGYHRLKAALAIRLLEVPCEVRAGTQRDALRNALGANAEHGLTRTNADKRHAVKVALADPEWAKLTHSALAEMVRVSPPLVAEVRAEIEATQNTLSATTRVDRNGREVDTANLGRKSATDRTPREPGDDDDVGEPVAVESVGDPEPDAEQAYLDSIPMRAELTDAQRTVFDRDALTHRRAEKALDALKAIGSAATKTGEMVGAWQAKAGTFLRLPFPHAWLLCKAAGCGPNCDHCKGRGYVVQ